MTSKTSSKARSGGDQYIHNQKESSERQHILNKCFRRTSHDAFEKSGILNSAAAARVRGNFRVIEIGCGAGFSTFDLAEWLPPHASITAIDTNEAMISLARQRLLSAHPEWSDRIEFRVENGEEAAKADGFACTFDAVWMRYVVVHVPDPIALIKAAASCLKPMGVLLIEDCNADGSICDPPLFANTLIHRAHIAASLKLGADVRRGPWIGGYMRQAGLENISCNSFVPAFGKGVDVQPWCNGSFTCSDDFDSTSHYNHGLKLLRMSLESAAPSFIELGTCKEEELEKARASLEKAESADYQLFSVPGGQTFQWWGTKPIGE
mmetsp:Transcript_25711/g.55697  ORF Transcript_25711/g.55697 Transcript_25711/m.55697 type:complete len:322 (-) Transcript_25711:50-1015(-)